jgi:hypothetical protein
MERFKTLDDLNKYLPNVFLFHVHFLLLAFTYALKNIAIIRKFHDDTKGW